MFELKYLPDLAAEELFHVEQPFRNAYAMQFYIDRLRYILCAGIVKPVIELFLIKCSTWNTWYSLDNPERVFFMPKAI